MAINRSFLFWLLRIFYEGVFTAETPSSQSSEYFLIKKSFLCALRASAVQFPNPAPQKSLETPSFLVRRRFSTQSLVEKSVFFKLAHNALINQTIQIHFADLWIAQFHEALNIL